MILGQGIYGVNFCFDVRLGQEAKSFHLAKSSVNHFYIKYLAYYLGNKLNYNQSYVFATIKNCYSLWDRCSCPPLDNS